VFFVVLEPSEMFGVRVRTIRATPSHGLVINILKNAAKVQMIAKPSVKTRIATATGNVTTSSVIVMMGTMTRIVAAASLNTNSTYFLEMGSGQPNALLL